MTQLALSLKTLPKTNRRASVRLAEMASCAGVKNLFLPLAARCMGRLKEVQRECDPINPLTAYARSKIGTEDDLRSANLGEMVLLAFDLQPLAVGLVD